MAQVKKEVIRLQRLRILQVLNMIRPDLLGDGLIRKSLSSELDIAPGVDACRKALAYLDERGLVKVESKTDDVWFARITADGIDYLDGMGDDLEGVARPSEY